MAALRFPGHELASALNSARSGLNAPIRNGSQRARNKPLVKVAITAIQAAPQMARGVCQRASRQTSMRSERCQIQPERRLEKASIASPEPRADGEAGRSKQVKIDIADADAEQPLVVEKGHHLDMLGQRNLGQGLQRANGCISLTQIAEGDLRDDEWVHEDLTFLEERLQF